VPSGYVGDYGKPAPERRRSAFKEGVSRRAAGEVWPNLHSPVPANQSFPASAFRFAKLMFVGLRRGTWFGLFLFNCVMCGNPPKSKTFATFKEYAFAGRAL